MKKIILFSLISTVCLGIITKTNTMQSWEELCQNDAPKFPGYGSCNPEFTQILSKNSSLKELRTAARSKILLKVFGRDIAQTCQLEQKQYPNSYNESICDKLLETLTRMYTEAIIKEEDIAPSYYKNPEHQAIHQEFINNLRKNLSQQASKTN